MGILRASVRRFRYMASLWRSPPPEPPCSEPLFEIKRGYRHRPANAFFDDTPLKDEWQREVYEAAADYARAQNFTSVADVGCGSAFKLLKHFAGFRTIGLD